MAGSWYALIHAATMVIDAVRHLPAPNPLPQNAKHKRPSSRTTVLSKNPRLRRPLSRPDQRDSPRRCHVCYRAVRVVSVGIIPGALAKLTQLEEIDLRENDFTGA